MSERARRASASGARARRRTCSGGSRRRALGPPLAMAVLLPRIARVVEPVAVELDGQPLLRPAAVDTAAAGRAVGDGQGEPVLRRSSRNRASSLLRVTWTSPWMIWRSFFAPGVFGRRASTASTAGGWCRSGPRPRGRLGRGHRGTARRRDRRAFAARSSPGSRERRRIAGHRGSGSDGSSPPRCVVRFGAMTSGGGASPFTSPNRCAAARPLRSAPSPAARTAAR